ncbi:MAG TPA: YiiD C-terminal domain-containing protein [Steroidobacteraceae bacterium]|nr:YiiD C-terminal domain-containing protein [Steroidobacteraceae bacterium]
MSNAQLTDLESLRAYLTARIAPARALGVRLEALDPVTLSAPLAANLNDKGTGFAGSLFSVAALAGWALVTRWCATESVDAEVVLQSSSARFLAPARADFRAIAHEPPAGQRDRLRRMLARSGRGRAEVAVDVKCHEALVMSFTGAYAVIASARAS